MDHKKSMASKINWILLGLVLLIPGLLKLFVAGQGAISDMLSGIALFAWAPAFWAWVLIASEIVAGGMILMRKQLHIWASIGAIILLVAALTVHWGTWPNVLVHLVVASNFWMLALKNKK